MSITGELITETFEYDDGREVINNLLDHHYYTAGQLGPTGFSAQGTFDARHCRRLMETFPVVSATFCAPGAPIRAWGGLKFSF